MTGTNDDLSQPLVGEWRVTTYLEAGSLVDPVAGTEPTITFAPDGHVAIATGCNRIVSRWQLHGSQITLLVPARTLMYCAEPVGVMDQEQALSDAVEAATRVEVDDDTLKLMAEDGSVVITAVPSVDQSRQ